MDEKRLRKAQSFFISDIRRFRSNHIQNIRFYMLVWHCPDLKMPRSEKTDLTSFFARDKTADSLVSRFFYRIESDRIVR